MKHIDGTGILQFRIHVDEISSVDILFGSMRQGISDRAEQAISSEPTEAEQSLRPVNTAATNVNKLTLKHNDKSTTISAPPVHAFTTNTSCSSPSPAKIQSAAAPLQGINFPPAPKLTTSFSSSPVSSRANFGTTINFRLSGPKGEGGKLFGASLHPTNPNIVKDNCKSVARTPFAQEYQARGEKRDTPKQKTLEERRAEAKAAFAKQQAGFDSCNNDFISTASPSAVRSLRPTFGDDQESHHGQQASLDITAQLADPGIANSA